MRDNWNEVAKIYEEEYLASRYADHSRGILELIPKLSEHTSLEDVEAGTSHAALFLRVPGKKTRVYVWAEQPGPQYNIYLYDGNRKRDEIAVGADKAVATIDEYVGKVRRE
jgi:hypothetical protein